jgi:hypothetical protein
MTAQLQPQLKSASPPSFTHARTGMLQRKCACGQHTGSGGECESCRKKREGTLQRAAVTTAPATVVSPIVQDVLRAPPPPLTPATRAFIEPRFRYDFSQVRVYTDVQSLQRQRVSRAMLPATSTNYAFDTFNVTEAQLSDPDIIARFNALSRAGLIEYRNRVADPAVQAYITGLLAAIPSVPCTANEVNRTNTKAEAARTASVPWVQLARAALDRLHSRWIDHKGDLLAGRSTLSGQVVCAFNSNFNITQSDPDYGVRQISVMSRLRQLESRLNRAVAYACQPEDDPICLGSDQDTVAYVRGGQPPIHFCSQFRVEPDTLSQQSTVVHEYTHLLPGVHDQGGYALGGFGAQVMTCQTGAKFRSTSDVLANTADALTGFVMHIGQTDATDIHVR